MEQKVGWFGSLRSWLAGKKTYLAAGLTMVLAGAGVGLGKLSFAQATTLVSIAGTAVGLGAKLERHQAEVAQELRDLAKVTADAAGHRYTALPADAMALATDGMMIARGAGAEKEQKG
jgi:fumarate hydratase class II